MITDSARKEDKNGAVAGRRFLVIKKKQLPAEEKQPISRAARINRIAVSGFFFMHGLCFASWASRIPSIQSKLALSASELGGILFALPCGFFVALPFAGWLIERTGSRKVVIFSALFYSVSLLCIGASFNIFSLVMALFSLGFFANLLNISMNTQAVAVEALYKKRLMATFHGLWSLAGFAGAAIGTWMIGNAVPPFQHYIFICIAPVLFICVGSFYLMKQDARAAEKQRLFTMPDKALLHLGLIAFCSMMAEGAMFDWSGVYFTKVVSVDQQLTGVGYTTFMIAMAGMRFLADGLTGKFGLKRILQLSGMLTTSGLLLAVLAPQLIPSLLGFFLIGLGVSSVVPLVYSAAGRSKTLSPGTAITAVSSLGFFGFLVGPPTIGFIAQASSLRISFLAISVMSIAVVVFSSFIRQEHADTK